MSNAVRHCHPLAGTQDAATVRVRLSRNRHRLLLEVFNPGAGSALPPPQEGSLLDALAESGRSLAVVRRLADGVGADHDGHTTRVWAEFDLSGAATEDSAP